MKRAIFFDKSKIALKITKEIFFEGVKFEETHPHCSIHQNGIRYILIFEYQILVLDLVVDIRTKISEGI